MVSCYQQVLVVMGLTPPKTAGFMPVGPFSLSKITPRVSFVVASKHTTGFPKHMCIFPLRDTKKTIFNPPQRQHVSTSIHIKFKDNRHSKSCISSVGFPSSLVGYSLAIFKFTHKSNSAFRSASRISTTVYLSILLRSCSLP